MGGAIKGQQKLLIDLGFAGAQLPAGTHICQIYSDGEERDRSLLDFLATGVAAGESAACFSDNLDAAAVACHFEALGLAMADAERDGRLTLSPTEAIYFRDGRFDPERMLELLTQFHESSVQAGRPAARVIGEMSPAIRDVPGGARLMEYESLVTRLLRTHPVTAVCQYSAHDFDGATIMDVLKVHPMMVVRGAVVHNPFYLPPEAVLT